MTEQYRPRPTREAPAARGSTARRIVAEVGTITDRTNDGRRSTMTGNGRSNGQAAHLTPEERAALGKQARASVPRSSQGEWSPAPDRRDPVEILEEQGASRIQELVPIR